MAFSNPLLQFLNKFIYKVDDSELEVLQSKLSSNQFIYKGVLANYKGKEKFKMMSILKTSNPSTNLNHSFEEVFQIIVVRGVNLNLILLI